MLFNSLKSLLEYTFVKGILYIYIINDLYDLNNSLDDVNKNLFTLHDQYKTSANTLKKNGIYSSTTWSDTGGNYGILIVFGDNSSYISQFFINVVDGTLWFRNTNNGTTWIEWKHIV